MIKIGIIKNNLEEIIILRKHLNKVFLKEEMYMSSNRSIMSEKLKLEIAKELGVFDQVKQDGGWQNVSSKTCGNIVSKAIEIANRNVE